MMVIINNYLSYFLTAAGTTLIFSAIVVVLGTVLGTLLAVMKLSKKIWILRVISSVYIEIIRGTPLMLQLLIFTMAIKIPEIPAFGAQSRVFMSCILALSLNSAAYVAEIVRSGIQSIDTGQDEAARSLGMSSLQTMTKIVLPQAIKNILPALGNEFVVVIKESSLGYAVGLFELMYTSRTVMAATFKVWEPLIMAAIIYFLLTFITSRIISRVERRMGDASKN